VRRRHEVLLGQNSEIVQLLLRLDRLRLRGGGREQARRGERVAAAFACGEVERSGRVLCDGRASRVDILIGDVVFEGLAVTVERRAVSLLDGEAPVAQPNRLHVRLGDRDAADEMVVVLFGRAQRRAAAVRHA
jgi:hypothetical protein